MKKNSKLTISLIVLALFFCISSAGSVSAADNNTTDSNNTTGLADSPYPSYQVDNQNTGQSNYTGPTTNTTKWTDSGGTEFFVIGSDGTRYVGSMSSTVVNALNSDGTVKWTTTLPTANGIRGLAIGKNEILYITICEGLCAVNTTDGTTIWTYNSTHSISSYSYPVIGSDGTIYFGDSVIGSTLYAVNPDGTPKWTYTVSGTTVSDVFITSPAMGIDGRIYFTTGAALYVLNTDGTLYWSYNATFTKNPVVGPDGTIYATTSNTLYAFNPDGSLKWTYGTTGKFLTAPSIASDGTIYIAASTGALYALTDNGTNVTVKWTYNDTHLTKYTSNFSIVIGADGTIYTGNAHSRLKVYYGSVYALNSDGSQKWYYAFTGKTLYQGAMIDSNGTLYVLTYNGFLYAFQDLIADFQTITEGTTVNFTDNSTNLPTSWIWDFGDGKISAEKNPTHTYTTPGNYTVTLTVSTEYGDTKSITKTIKVGTFDTTAPTVTVNPSNGTYNITQSVSLISDDSTATIYYTTDGTDPTSSSTPYTAPIIIDTTTTLKYAAVDPAGNWSPIYTQTYIIEYVNPTLTSSFTSNVTNGTENTTIQFTDTSTGKPTSWYWDFGDGKTSTEQNPSHTYTTPGNYTVTLTVSDENSTNSTISRYILIYGSAAANKFTNPGFENGTTGWTVGSTSSTSNTLSHEGNNSVYFSNAGTSNTNYISQTVDLTLVDSISFWGYGETTFNNYFCVYIDGKQIGDPLQVLAGKWSLYTVNTSNYTGLHTINITSFIKGASAFVDDLSVTITQNLANFTTNTTNTANEPLTVQFTDQSKGLITGWAWDFDGDGVTDSTQQNPTHTYTKPGTYTVKLTVTGPYHNSTMTLADPFIVVGPTNNRTNTTYTTIQEAIDNALDGDTISIGNLSYLETYTENINVNKRLNIIAIGNVIIKALDANKPTITILSSGLGSVINGFTITGATNSSGIFISALTNATLTNNTIIGNDIGINVYGNATINNTTLSSNRIGINNSGNTSITNNTIIGNEIGVNTSGNASIISNTITGNGIGVNVDNGSSSLHFNNIYSNTMYGLKFTGNNVDASNNWWGTNNPTYKNGTTAPSNSDIYEAQDTRHEVYNPWIVLNVTTSDDLLKNGDNATITVDMTHNSQGQNTSGSGSIPELPVNFNYALGTLSTNTTVISRGKANIILTGGNVSGTTNLTATVTGCTVAVPITVDTIAPTVDNSLEAGKYNTSQTVTLTTDDPAAIIYYTNDSTDPRTSITRLQYTGSFSINQTTTLRYSAVDPAGNWSPVYVQNYVIGTQGLGDSDWPGFQNNENNTGQSDYNGPQTNSTKWTFNGLTVYGSAVIGSDGTIYVAGYDGILYAFNSNGILKWTWTTRSYIIGSPTIGTDGTIYITNWVNSTTYAISSNGTLLWKYNTGDYGTCSPVLSADGTIYIVTTNTSSSTLYALYPTGTLKWTRNMGIVYGSSPVIGNDGTIYIADHDGVFYAINTDGTVRWTYNLTYSIYSANMQYNSASIGSDGTIYIVSCTSYYGNYYYYDSEGKLHQLCEEYTTYTGPNGCCIFALTDNGTSGVLKWVYHIQENLYGTPAISSNGTIYIVGSSNLYALTDNGTSAILQWKYPTGGVSGTGATSAAIGSNGTIYVGSSTGVYAIKPDGTLLWKYNTDSIVGSPAIASDGTLYIGTTNGTFYAFNDRAVDFTIERVNGTTLTVQFKGNSTVTPVTSWKWYFGDGNTSTEQNPIHTYAKAGKYTIFLVATLSDGSTLLRQVTVNIEEMDITAPQVNTNLPGGTYNNTQTVTLTAADNKSNATVYYTTDGSDPLTSSTRRIYTQPITIYDSTTIKFAAVDSSGNWSPVYTESYTIINVIYVEDASHYSTSTINQDIQRILDNAKDGSVIVFRGAQYENLQLVLNKPLTLISNTGTTVVTSSSGTAVFLINGNQASGSQIIGFNIITNTTNGILINNTSNVTISNVQVTSKGGTGIQVNRSSNVNISGTSATDSSTGIDVSNSSNIKINGSTVTGNSKRGIRIYNSNNVTVTSSTLKNNGKLSGIYSDEGAVYMESSDNITIRNNIINNNSQGVTSKDSSNITVTTNTINNNAGEGILLSGSANNISITWNDIEHNANGVQIDYTSGNNVTITSNIINNSESKEVSSHAEDVGNGINFGVNWCGTLATIESNVIAFNEHRDIDAHDEGHYNEDASLHVGVNVYTNSIVDINHRFCCKIGSTAAKLMIASNEDGTYKIYFTYPDGSTMTNLPSITVDVTLNNVLHPVTLGDAGIGYLSVAGSDAIGTIIAQYANNVATRATLIPNSNPSHEQQEGLTTYPNSGPNSGNTGGEQGNGNTGTGTGTGSGNIPGTATSSGTSGSSSNSGSASGTLALGAAAAASASGSSSTGSSSDSQGSNGNSQSKTIQELVMDEVEHNSSFWGIIGIIVLLVAVIMAYYRKPIKNMLKKSKK